MKKMSKPKGNRSGRIGEKSWRNGVCRRTKFITSPMKKITPQYETSEKTCLNRIGLVGLSITVIANKYSAMTSQRRRKETVLEITAPTRTPMSMIMALPRKQLLSHVKRLMPPTTAKNAPIHVGFDSKDSMSLAGCIKISKIVSMFPQCIVLHSYIM